MADSTPTPTPLRKNSGFRLLWIGQTLSDVGSNAGAIAYPLLVLALTHSAVIAGAVGTISGIVSLGVRLPAGTLSDRLDRRRTMVICDSIRTLVLALLGGLVLVHSASWPVVALVAIVDRTGGAIFGPSAVAALPAIVRTDQLEAAWAATEARLYGAELIGPAVGGALFAIGQAIPFLGDALSYAVSAVMVGRIHGRFRPKPGRDRTSLWHETLDGLRAVRRHALLRAVVIQAPMMNFAFSGVIFTITLDLRQHGYSASLVGLVQAGVALGGVLGAAIAPRLQGRLTLSRLMVSLSSASAVLFTGGALLIPSPLVAIPVAAAFLLAPTGNASLMAVMLRSTPDEMRGRVNNTVTTATGSLAAVAPITAGLLVQDLSGAWAMGLFAAVMAVATGTALLLNGLKASGEKQLAT